MPVPIAVMIAWISSFESTLLIRFFSALMTFPRSGRIAWKSGRGRRLPSRRPSSPSTRKSSADLGSDDLAVGELPGQRVRLERALAPRELARLARRLARARGRHRLREDLASHPSGSPRGTRRASGSRSSSTNASIRGFPSFVFVCPSNCGFRSFTEMTAARPSRTSSPSRLSSFSFSEPLLARVAVQRPGERGLEAREMRPALGRVDVVREREDGLDVRAVPLHRDLDLALLVASPSK